MKFCDNVELYPFLVIRKVNKYIVPQQNLYNVINKQQIKWA